jgi:hypothetical protein
MAADRRELCVVPRDVGMRDLSVRRGGGVGRGGGRGLEGGGGRGGGDGGGRGV